MRRQKITFTSKISSRLLTSTATKVVSGLLYGSLVLFPMDLGCYQCAAFCVCGGDSVNMLQG